VPAVSTTHRIDVALGERSYPIHIAPGLIESGRAAAAIKERVGERRVLVIVDEQVAVHHGERFARSLAGAGIAAAVCRFPGGETSKDLATAERLWKACAEHRLDRTGTIIALGGGVTGDLAGFVAACWMRGVDFIQVPTTLLAMVDSSVGGKTGVNSAAGKNLIGAFKQPACVLIDPTVLATMDAREYRAGLAEVLKYGVIRDAGFFAWQEAHAEALAARDPAAVAHAVAESCRIKAWYVAEDETEQGVRAELNYGHTFGHALERETGYRTYLHGEAVGIGMRMAATLARRLGVLADAGLEQRQDALLRRYQLPLVHRSAEPAAEAGRLAGHCRLDKKVAAGRVRFILPTRLGAAALREVDDAAAVEAAFASALAPAGA
jgi:3-dehydroquinate synthase